MVQFIDTAFAGATSALRSVGADERYSGYQVGYFGDYAGVYLKLTNPVRSESVQHLKFKDIHKEVMTEGEHKTREQIKAMAESDEFGPKDKALIVKAHQALEAFIERNGRYRPMSTLDLEGR
ncbi:MAG: hypothetical protein RBR86_02765 [Pseudobdellovibrionaceae bacterium]|jgi:hypothetical protein|nr:hypothetical protein [Pseudobdellovibrionaceae bacterium]